MNDKNLGPLLYDSLDKPNASVNRQPQQRKQDYTAIVAIIVGTISLLFSLLFLYVMSNLRMLAADYDSTATFLIWLLYVSVVGALSAGILFATAFGLLWLWNWAIKQGYFSIQDGPHYHARDKKIDYNLLAEAMEVQAERARQSRYQGVSTLTIDQSTSTTSTTNDTKVDATKTSSSDTDGFDLLLLDQLNKE